MAQERRFAVERGRRQAAHRRIGPLHKQQGHQRTCQPQSHQAHAAIIAAIRLLAKATRMVKRSPLFILERTAFFAWRRGAQAGPRELESWIRAGERKTCWAKPLFVPPRLWALNAAGSFADASSEHSEQRLEGADHGSRAFGPSSQPGSDRLAHGQGPRWLSLHKRPHSDLAGNSASCGWSSDTGS